MRKFFFFRSSSASGGESGTVDPPENRGEKAFWERPWQSDAEEGGKEGHEARGDSSLGSLISKKRREGVCPGLKRSFSFSGERVSRHMAEQSDALGCEDAAGCCAKDPVCYRSLTPERPSVSKRCDLEAVRRTYAFESGNSPGSYKDYHSSCGDSPYSSPIPLRCRVARIKRNSIKKKVQDLYIDGEKEHTLRKDGCLIENKTIANSWRPPRAYSTAPSSPICKENLQSQPLRDVNDFDHYLSSQGWENCDTKISPKKYSKKFEQGLSNAFSGRARTHSQEYDSETTTTVEDIYEDTGHVQVASDIAENGNLSDNLCHYKMARGYYLHDVFGNEKEGCFNEERPWLLKNEEEIDKGLGMKLMDARERLRVLSDTEFGSIEHQNGEICLSSCLQLIKDMDRDRRNLAMELVTQLECRIAERSSTKEALRMAEAEFSTKTRRLEREKHELQSCLEKELDRRSSDWLSKLEKFRVEEQRLRERVRELAEQNVSLQREVSSLNGRETDTQDRITNLELQLSDLTVQLEEVKKENQNLHQALSELKERCDLAEADRDCIKRNYKVKENENSELQKIVGRFQKMCLDNERTISGLRHGLGESVEQSQDRTDLIRALQSEQHRLTGVEQALRKEIESTINEVKLLRHENTCLLERLQSATGASGSSSWFRLDIELQSRVEYLQNQGLALLYENTDLCGQLLNLVEAQQFKQGKESIEYDAYSVVEYSMKFHGLKRGVESLKRSLHVLSLALKEKSQEFSGSLSQPSNSSSSKQRERDSVGHIELELKAETLLTKMLREKLLSKEMDLEQLQSDLVSSLRANEVLRSDIQKLHDELCSLTHKATDMEHQLDKKDEGFKQLDKDFKECLKELSANKSLLPKVSKERDNLWEEVKLLKETDMLFKYEVKSLKKKIEALEEDILVKDGQISILKDSLDSKPFDILSNPDS